MGTTRQRRWWCGPVWRARAWVGDRVWATALWMTVVAGTYWMATLIPNFSVFVLTDEIADRPGDGPYTTKALMSIARGAAMPLGFASTLFGPVRRMIGSGWRRPVGLVVYALLFTGVPNVAFVIESVTVRVASRFVGSFFFSWAFCAYIAYAQGRRASDVVMPVTTVCMLLAASVSRAISPAIGRRIADSEGGANDNAYAWMPVMVSALLVVPMAMGAIGLAASPQPTEADARSRMRRTEVSDTAGRAWLRKHWPVVLGMAASNTVLQSVRVVRDIFASDFLGADAPAWQWIVAEAPACIGASLFYANLAFVKSHHRAFVAVAVVGLVAGAIMAAIGASGLAGAVSPLCFLIVSGIGYFLAVVPFAGGGAVVERLIAASRMPVDSMFVNVICQLPGHVGALGVLIASPLAPDPAAYFGWTVFGGGVVLLASYAWTLAAAWCVLFADGGTADHYHHDDDDDDDDDYNNDLLILGTPRDGDGAVASPPDSRAYGTFVREQS